YTTLFRSGEDDDAVRLGVEADVAALRADRRADLDPVAVDYRDVHEQVERRRRLRRLEAEFGERRGEIVGAVVVVFGAAQKLVAPTIAGGEERVVDAAGGVLGEREDPTAAIGDERVADPRDDPA